MCLRNNSEFQAMGNFVSRGKKTRSRQVSILTLENTELFLKYYQGKKEKYFYGTEEVEKVCGPQLYPWSHVWGRWGYKNTPKYATAFFILKVTPILFLFKKGTSRGEINWGVII